MHHSMPMLGGAGLVVLGIVLFMTNYGVMDASIWQWLFPLSVVLAGIHCSMMKGMDRMERCKMMSCMKDDCKGDCKDGSCCKTDKKTDGMMDKK